MIIRLDEIDEEPFTWDCSEDISVASLDCPDLVDLSTISWRGRVERTPPYVRLTADLEYQQTLSCTRCLQPIHQQLENQIDLRIQVGFREFGGGEHELEETEMNVLVLNEEELDTDLVLKDHLALNFPMKGLCKEDCAGLCPECGVDRNQVLCGCDNDAPDPRWSALKLLGSADN
jgi:uncharacterized protein